VPLHGPWSDYSGFDADRRAEYYQNVRGIAAEYGVQTLDLTGHEYEEYFMCDTMHLGWKGWLAVDKALIEYYYGG
jgi:D-alanine transfer protein